MPSRAQFARPFVWESWLQSARVKNNARQGEHVTTGNDISSTQTRHKDKQAFVCAHQVSSVTEPLASPAMDRTLQRSASALGRFLASSSQWTRSDGLGRAEALAQDLLNVLRQDLEPELVFHTRGRSNHIITLSQWRRKFYNQNIKMKTMQKQLLLFRSSRRLGKHGLINAGLSETRTSLRSVEAWGREFAIDDVNPLSHVTVSQARDAFGHLLVNFNREDMTRYTNGITHGFVIIRHLHDEATMRLRSQLPADPPASHGSAAAPAAEHGLPRIPDSRRVPLRGRSSKIQNNVATMHRNSTDKPLSVLLELQPLARKTAETMATALRQVIETVANQIAASTHPRRGALRVSSTVWRGWHLHK